MILLDTNIISEVMKPAPSEQVLDWLNAQNSNSLFVASVSIGEITYGLRVIPEGKRQSRLNERFEQFVAIAFSQRVVPYDESAARIYGDIMATRKALGRPMSIADGQIAAIARSNHFSIATRNTRDFEECALELINPFVANT